jgi:hypothetical protein
MRSVTLPKLPLLWPTFATPLLTPTFVSHPLGRTCGGLVLLSKPHEYWRWRGHTTTYSEFKKKMWAKGAAPGLRSRRKTATPRPRFKNRTWAPGSRQKLDYWAAAFGLKKLLASTSCLGVIRRPRDLRRLEARPSPVALAREYHAYAAT